MPKETNGDNQKTLLLITVKFLTDRKYTVILREKTSLSRPIVKKAPSSNKRRTCGAEKLKSAGRLLEYIRCTFQSAAEGAKRNSALSIKRFQEIRTGCAKKVLI